MTKQERIAQLLAAGTAPAEICSIVGVAGGYIQALKEDEDFKILLTKYMASDEIEESKQSEDQRLDDKYVALEHKLVNQLNTAVGMLEPMQAIKLLDNISQRNDKRRSGLNKPDEPGQGAVVHISLNMPQHAIPEQPVLTISQDNEVVGVDNRSLAPMATEGVRALIDQHRNKPEPASESDEILDAFPA